MPIGNLGNPCCVPDGSEGPSREVIRLRDLEGGDRLNLSHALCERVHIFMRCVVFGSAPGASGRLSRLWDSALVHLHHVILDGPHSLQLRGLSNRPPLPRP